VAQDSTPTWQDLLDLVTQLTESELESASVSFGSISVSISKTGELPGIAAVSAPAPAPTSTAPAALPAAPVAPAAVAPTAAPTGPAITAPMLGVFYRRPSPGADPFVAPGDTVEPDTTIGIIEIMKLMNPVVAGASGVIASFAVEDGTAVQFGETLALLEPAVP
jgi:acetyl-CoA carboxylase biotin carboxyl carrier protein